MGEAVPKRIGRYEIHEELGRGMMGVVYRAHDSLLDRTVALKTIQLAMVSTAEDRQSFEQRFFTEARSAARLSHPGIVVVHDVGRDPESGTLFMALEHLRGKTLAAATSAGQRLEWRETLRIVARVAEALHHAHSHGVVHRDIKPANIMVLETGEPKIMDFGIAKLAASGVQLTSTGQFFGTPLFMAPEQALGEPVDGRSDLFSLGSVAYQLVTGVRPFDAENVPRILARVAYETAPPPSILASEIPPEVDYLLARLLAKPPEDRYPDGRTVAEDAEDILAGRPPRHRAGWTPRRSGLGTIAAAAGLESGPHALRPAAPLPGPAASRPRRARRRWLLAAVAPLLAAALGLALHSLTARTTGDKPPAGGDIGRAAPARSVTKAPTPLPGTLARLPPSPTPSAAPAPASGTAPAHALLSVDFEHHFRSGRLWVWMDKQLILDRQFEGEVTKDLGLAKLRKGEVETALAIPPGWHDIWVEVRWEDNRKTKGISGSFQSGVTRNLKIRTSRIRKSLSLDWE